MARWLTWVSEPERQGWTCSECEWISPLPSLLSDPEARSAYDRLSAARFQQHDCGQHRRRMKLASDYSFAERARNLVHRGFKPKDAVEITLQEITLEHRNEPQKIQQARQDAEDFLRRVKQGLV
jgi:hypothetical protein